MILPCWCQRCAGQISHSKWTRSDHYMRFGIHESMPIRYRVKMGCVGGAAPPESPPDSPPDSPPGSPPGSPSDSPSESSESSSESSESNDGPKISPVVRTLLGAKLQWPPDQAATPEANAAGWLAVQFMIQRAAPQSDRAFDRQLQLKREESSCTWAKHIPKTAALARAMLMGRLVGPRELYNDISVCPTARCPFKFWKEHRLIDLCPICNAVSVCD